MSEDKDDKVNNKLEPNLKAVHDSMMDGLGQLADYFGYNRVMGELYASLLLNPNPMSLDELKDRVRKSKASVSMNTRILEHMGVVREVWIRDDNPGNRKYYEAETDFWKILTRIFGGRELRDLDKALSVLEESLTRLRKSRDDMSPDNKVLAEHYIQSIDRLSDLFRFARLVLTSILERGKDLDIGEVKRIDIE